MKYEEGYIKEYKGVKEAVEGLGIYFIFYNDERLHQSLGYKTPSQIYYGDVRGGNVYSCKSGINGSEGEGKRRSEVTPVALRAPSITSHNN